MAYNLAICGGGWHCPQSIENLVTDELAATTGEDRVAAAGADGRPSGLLPMTIVSQCREQARQCTMVPFSRSERKFRFRPIPHQSPSGRIELDINSQSLREEEEKGSDAHAPGAFLSPRRTIPQLVLAILISALLLVPCVWLPQIESFDLCSHIYNAWLARLISEQRVPGLYMVHQSTNILFDNLLTLLMKQFGSVLAQRIAVSASVLLFFWSSFTFIAVFSGRRPWFLVPFLAILSYGRIFHYGFFNFYISLAFSLLGLASFWKRSPWSYVLFILTMILSWTAHPLPALWALAIAVYVYAARNRTRKVRIALLCSTALGVLMVGLYERIRFPNSAGSYQGMFRTLLGITGLDQILAFDRRFSIFSYRFVEMGMILVFMLLFFQRLRREKKVVFDIPAQLYVLTTFAALALPSYKFYFPEAFKNSLGFISERFSLVASVLACVVVAGTNPKQWQRGLLLVLAIMFFLVVYQDERSLVELEEKVTALVNPLPPLQRVAAMLHFPGVAEDGFTENLVDRACVSRCYSYGNYEASTLQFRIRAARNNPYILAEAEESGRLARGTYLVQPRDLPLYQIYPCGTRITDLCMRALKAGELNGSLVVHPKW